MRHQLCPISAECVRLDDVDAGFDVVEVHFAHQLRLRKVQFVETTADEDAFTVKHRTHRAIADENPVLQGRKEVFHVNGKSSKSA